MLRRYFSPDKDQGGAGEWTFRSYRRPPRRSSPTGRASSPRTRAAGRSRSASTRSASSRPRRRGAPTASSSSRPRAPRSSSAASSSSTRRSARARPTARRFPKLLESKGIVPGIKVDTGAKPLALAEGETVTEGLDGLRERLAEYRELGARFAKWRAVITIGKDIPSEYCIWTNAHALARYAALCQEGGHRPDRRAGGPHGRRPHDRAQLRRHVARRCTPCSPSCATSASSPKGSC